MNARRLARSLALLCLAATTLLNACGVAPSVSEALAPPTAAPSSEITPNSQSNAPTVTLWTHGGTTQEVDALSQTFKVLRDQHSDINIDVVYMPENTYDAQVRAASYGASIVGDLPCLIDFDGPYVYSYVARGFLLPLDSYISPEMKADFLPSIIKQGTYQDGKLYSLGQFDSGLAIWGNRTYLEQAGVRIPTVAHPWNRAEFEEALARLQALPAVEHALDLRMDIHSVEGYTYSFSPILQSFGADLIDRTGYRSADGVLNGPAAKDALEMVQGWVKRGYVNLEPSADQEFVQGKAALSWVGHWMKAPYSEALGDKLILLPMPDFGHGPKTGVGSWNWGISTACKNPRAAWEVLSFLLQPDQILRMTNANGAPPARKSALAQSELYRPGGLLHLYIEQSEAGFAVPRPITPAYPVITKAFANAFKDIVRGANVKKELDQAVKEIDQGIKDNNGNKPGQ